MEKSIGCLLLLVSVIKECFNAGLYSLDYKS